VHPFNDPSIDDAAHAQHRNDFAGDAGTVSNEPFVVDYVCIRCLALIMSHPVQDFWPSCGRARSIAVANVLA
jgi:hypothetical protein